MGWGTVVAVAVMAALLKKIIDFSSTHLSSEKSACWRSAGRQHRPVGSWLTKLEAAASTAARCSGNYEMNSRSYAAPSGARALAK